MARREVEDLAYRKVSAPKSRSPGSIHRPRSLHILHGREIVPLRVAAIRVAIPVVHLRAAEIGDEGLEPSIVGHLFLFTVARPPHHDGALRSGNPGVPEDLEHRGVPVGIDLVPGLVVDATPHPRAGLGLIRVIEVVGPRHLLLELSSGERSDGFRQVADDRLDRGMTVGGRDRMLRGKGGSPSLFEMEDLPHAAAEGDPEDAAGTFEPDRTVRVQRPAPGASPLRVRRFPAGLEDEFATRSPDPTRVFHCSGTTRPRMLQDRRHEIGGLRIAALQVTGLQVLESIREVAVRLRDLPGPGLDQLLDLVGGFREEFSADKREDQQHCEERFHRG